MRLARSIVAAVLIVVAVPAGIVAIRAGAAHERLRDDARREVVAETTVLRQMAQHLFETQDLVLDLVGDMAGDADDAALRTPETRSRLAAIVASLRQTVSIWISDAQGDIVTGSRAGGENISQRDFFIAHRAGFGDTFVSAPFVGRASGQAAFAMSRRRLSKAGEFAGTIHVAISTSYVRDALRTTIDEGTGVAILARADGVIIVRHPSTPGVDHYPPDGPEMRMIAASPQGGVGEGLSSLDGMLRSYAHRPLDRFGVSVVYGVDLPGRIAAWRSRTLAEGGIAALVALIAGSASWIVWRSAMARRAALNDLKQEVELRSEVERRLREVKALEALGLMARGVAHDVNNLLTVVLGNLETIEESSADRTVRDIAHRAKTAAAAGAELAANLLAYSRTQVLRIESVAVAPILGAMQPLLQDLATPKVEVVLDVDPAVPSCRTDLAQFRAAITNLVTNARDAMPDGGRVVVSARSVMLGAGDLREVPGAEAGQFVAIAVTDSGTGMIPEVAARAFDPFYTTKAIGSGSGLGLSQVFGLMHQLRGTVSLRTAPGEGTSVTLHFPVGATAEPLALPPDAPQSVADCPPPTAVESLADAAVKATAAKILVVEDQPEIRDLARRLLSRAGYDVMTVSGGNEALEVMSRGGRFDLVLSDIVMPNDMDGLTLVKRVREVHPSTAVVLMSGYAPDTAALSAAEARFVSKPFTRSALLEAVRQELPSADSRIGVNGP